MADDIAIKVENVSKTFKLPHEKNNSIKGAVVNFYKRNKSYETQEVLKDVSFEIKKGEFFGIVGRNGSGKSTLLKLIAGIYSPSKGAIKVNGRLTPFIELGVGFNMELTGRENVFLNGALLGFNRKEMLALYDEIVEFAELEKFMDQKLKNYSSGMQVRLAFSIAIRAKSDVLILDEVLAVGDESFQQKCIDVFESYKSRGQTVVLVTHDMSTVRRFCNQAILINDGNIIREGEPNEIATEYSRLNREIIEREIKNTPKIESGLAINLLDLGGKKQKSFNSMDKMVVKLAWSKDIQGIKNAGIAIIKNSGEYMFGSNTLKSDLDLSTTKTATYEVNLDLGPGKYHVMVGLFGASDDEIIEFIHHGPEFIIDIDPDATEQGMVRLRNKWLKKVGNNV